MFKVSFRIVPCSQCVGRYSWSSENHIHNHWLAVLTILKNISQWEGLYRILWKIKNVWNHQPGHNLPISWTFWCNIHEHIYINITLYRTTYWKTTHMLFRFLSAWEGLGIGGGSHALGTPRNIDLPLGFSCQSSCLRLLQREGGTGMETKLKYVVSCNSRLHKLDKFKL